MPCEARGWEAIYTITKKNMIFVYHEIYYRIEFTVRRSLPKSTSDRRNPKGLGSENRDGNINKNVNTKNNYWTSYKFRRNFNMYIDI